MSSRDLGTYEMLWDCASCGTRGLLGKSNRHCPNCGAVQNPEWRYFPEPGKEKEVTNYTFEGTDRTCPYCATPNGAKANNCKNCGAALDGSQAVQHILDDRTAPLPQGRKAAPAPNQLAGRSGCSGVVYIIAAVAGALFLFFLIAVLWKKEVHVKVAGHRWQREIAIERYAARSESSWCDSMPGDAYSIRRSREQRSTRSIPDGEECTTSNRDNGDGTFTRVENCHPKYREEPVYDDKCYYTVNRWGRERAVTSAGASLVPAPTWPAVSLARTGQCLGCEREGARSEHYFVQLRGKDSYECEVDAALWQRFQLDDDVPMKVRVVGGGADCSSLKPRG
jgi:hypothetical protein